MKKLAISLLIISLFSPLLVKTIQAQTPEGFVYQAEVRNNKGRIVSNKPIELYVSILPDKDINSSTVWDRDYLDIVTDKYGMISVIVGDNGNPQNTEKLFKDIGWGLGTYYLYVVADGNPMGEPVLLMSVPYALHAKTAGTFNEESPVISELISRVEVLEETVIILNPQDDYDGDGYTELQNDCDDNDPNKNPGITEICGDGIDQDCDGYDLLCPDDVDDDGDGLTENEGDCDDTNPDIPFGPCDGSDSDNCTEGIWNCNPTTGFAECSDNSDDNIEVCNGIDDNCDGQVDEGFIDSDVDNCGACGQACPEGWSCVAGVCTAPDFDQDGYRADIDCDDSDNTIYPGAIEIRDDGIDQDCNGNDLETATFQLNSQDPIEAAKSMGIYDGLESAEWVLPDGTTTTQSTFAMGYGILNSFGSYVSPLEGGQILALSTGTARLPGDADYQEDLNKGIYHGLPSGFPLDFPGCPSASNGNDGVALKITLQVPENVTGFSFNYKFYSKEFPTYACTQFNDQAIAIVNPAPLNSTSGNVMFDEYGNPVMVGDGTAITFCNNTCISGNSELIGTGFENFGGTAWMETVVPVQSNTTIEITFAIWDSSDNILTSTLLLDNWQWITD